MTLNSLSSRSDDAARSEPRDLPRRPLFKGSATAGTATALLLAFGFAACVDDTATPDYAVPDGGQPIYSTGGGGLVDSGFPGTGSTSPGQVYTVDAGYGVGSFGGTNGNAGGGSVNPTGGAGALTAGLGTLGGTTGAIGGLTGIIAGGSGTGGLIGGIIGGITGGTGSTGPATPLDPSVKKPDPSKLPKVNGACPDLSRSGTVTVAGSQVVLTVGSKPGPVYFYFHGTGTAPNEVDQALPGVSASVRANGGIVASWETSNEKGESTGSVWAVWFTGDFEAADQILACGIEKGIVDTGRIHVSGYSAGGLQAGAMLFMRSNYIASGIVYSGGKGFGAGALQDASNAPAVLGSHGAQGSDWLILDFSDGTKAVEQELKKAGGFAADCDDGGSHIDFALGRAGLNGKATQFLTDHPYNTKPSPYAGGMPAGFPSNCKVQ